jgi:hypothetical protein
MKKIVLIALSFSVQVWGEMPATYKALTQVLPFDDFGVHAHASPLETIFKEKKVKVAVELGCWLGKSTRHIASLLPEEGAVYAIGHWLGAKSLEENRDHYVQKPYDQFLSNMIHAGLTHKVIPLRGTTAMGVRRLREQKIEPDLIYIDSSHEEESVYEDLKTIFPLLKATTILCGNDWTWLGKNGFSVRNAVIRFASENHLRIKIYNGDFWLLEGKGESVKDKG